MSPSPRAMSPEGLAASGRSQGCDRVRVGADLRASGLDREHVFLTTKLWNDDRGHPTLDAFEASRRRLGVDVIDLYLVRWPVRGLRLDTWRAMEQLLETGRVRSIGVSNYMVRHLEELHAIERAGGSAI